MWSFHYFCYYLSGLDPLEIKLGFELKYVWHPCYLFFFQYRCPLYPQTSFMVISTLASVYNTTDVLVWEHLYLRQKLLLKPGVGRLHYPYSFSLEFILCYRNVPTVSSLSLLTVWRWNQSTTPGSWRLWSQPEVWWRCEQHQVGSERLCLSPSFTLAINELYKHCFHMLWYNPAMFLTLKNHVRTDLSIKYFHILSCKHVCSHKLRWKLMFEIEILWRTNFIDMSSDCCLYRIYGCLWWSRCWTMFFQPARWDAVRCLYEGSKIIYGHWNHSVCLFNMRLCVYVETRSHGDDTTGGKYYVDISMWRQANMSKSGKFETKTPYSFFTCSFL